MSSCKSYKQIFLYALLNIASVSTTQNGRNETEFVCPYNGEITGINYRYAETVDQIAFICSSSMGNKTLGPYGGNGNENGEMRTLYCPVAHYISSFYGSTTTKLNRVGIRCRPQNNLYGEDELVGDIGEKVGTDFDGLSPYNRSRPVSGIVTLGNSNDIVAYRVNYSNISKQEKIDCSYEWSERHGSPVEGEKVAQFDCPDDAAIFGLEYTLEPVTKRAATYSFLIKSAMGELKVGPFGAVSENNILGPIDRCDESQHISYFTNTEPYHIFLNKVCINSGDTKMKPPHIKVDDDPLTKANMRYGLQFDDKCHSVNPVRRPVSIILYSTTYVHDVKIQYKSIPVEVNCKLSRLEVAGHDYPQLVGYGVLGSTVAATCSESVQQLCLGVTKTDSISAGYSKSTATQVVFTVTPGKTFTVGSQMPLPPDIVAELSFELGGAFVSSVSWVSAETNDTTAAIEKSHKALINYQGPGAAVVVGYRAIYKIDFNHTEAIYRFKCEGSSRLPITTHISTTGKAFGYVRFQDYHFPFNKTKCTTQLRMCISRILVDSTVMKPKLLENKLKTEVDRCLAGERNR